LRYGPEILQQSFRETVGLVVVDLRFQMLYDFEESMFLNEALAFLTYSIEFLQQHLIQSREDMELVLKLLAGDHEHWIFDLYFIQACAGFATIINPYNLFTSHSHSQILNQMSMQKALENLAGLVCMISAA
jgi:hypothetical protein